MARTSIPIPPGTVALSRSQPLPPQIADDIKTRILSGQFPMGAQLPGLAALAEFYGEISEPTVVNGLKLLVAGGWITKEGAYANGYRVASVLPTDAQLPAYEDDDTGGGSEAMPAPPPPASKVVEAYAPRASIVLCAGCGAWAELSSELLAALPAGLALYCADCRAPVAEVRLDPAKRLTTVR